jgi:antitoxin component YwqK of YwqJK toxin-antitoxin module
MKKLIIILFLLSAIAGRSQNATNQTDAQGRKQGSWTKRDAEGHIIYQATFKDDKPVGEMKRFHSNGIVKAILTFEEGNNQSGARLFDENGRLVARGKYDGQKKIGEWTYLDDSKIIATENYENGLKNGVCKRFYKTGELLEESNWTNNRINGMYCSYYPGGQIQLECNYKDGKRNGIFKTYYTGGKPEIDGFYFSDSRDKDWFFYDENGDLSYTLKFDRGRLLNPEVQERIEKERSKLLGTKKSTIPDPEEFIQNPEEYMQLMQKQ